MAKYRVTRKDDGSYLVFGELSEGGRIFSHNVATAANREELGKVVLDLAQKVGEKRRALKNA